MGSSASIPAPQKTPSAAENYASWLGGYTGQTDNRLAAELADLGILQQLNQAYNQNNLDLSKSMTPEYMQFMMDAQKQYGSGMNDWYLSEAQRLGDAYKTASIDPQAAKIMAALGDQVHGDVLAGGNLNAEENRQVEQAVRAAQISRGMTHGSSAEFQEAVEKTVGGQNLKSQRQNAAMSFLNLQKQTQGDPLSFVMGNAGSYANGIFNPASVNYQGVSALTGQAMDMDNQSNIAYNQGLYNTNALNAQNKANASSGLGSALGMAVGGIGGFFAGGPMGAMAGASLGGGMGGSLF